MTTLPNGLVHDGMYKAGWIDYTATCSLTVRTAVTTLSAGTYVGVLNKDLTFTLAQNGSVLDMMPLLGVDGVLTSRR